MHRSFRIYSNIVYNFAQVKSNIYLRQSKQNTYRPIIEGRLINLCKFVQKPSLDPYLRIIMERFTTYTNLYKECPVRKVWAKWTHLHFVVTMTISFIQGTYRLVNYTFRSSSVPQFVPVGKYFIRVRTYALSPTQTFRMDADWQFYVDLKR